MEGGGGGYAEKGKRWMNWGGRVGVHNKEREEMDKWGGGGVHRKREEMDEQREMGRGKNGEGMVGEERVFW